jgi:hypothetical protein
MVAFGVGRFRLQDLVKSNKNERLDAPGERVKGIEPSSSAWKAGHKASDFKGPVISKEVTLLRGKNRPKSTKSVTTLTLPATAPQRLANARAPLPGLRAPGDRHLRACLQGMV